MKKSKSDPVSGGKTRSLASMSLIIFLLDKLTDVVYNAFKEGFFGKIFTSYSRLQSAFEECFIRTTYVEDPRAKRYFRNIRKYFSQLFETSLFLNKMSRFTQSIVSMPLKTIGNALFSFGVYVVLIYLLRLFLPVISAVDVSYAITGVIACIISVPMLLSHDNIASAVQKSVVLGTLFTNIFGFDDESLRKRTEMSRAKINLTIIGGMLLGILSIVVHPLLIIVAVLVAIVISLMVVSPEIGILIAIFLLPFLSFFDSPAIMMGILVLVISASYLVKLIRGKRIIKLEIMDLAVIMFAVIIYFSGAITSGGIMGYHEALISCELMLGYFLVVNLIRTEKWVKRCVYSLVSSGTIVAMIGIAQYFLGILPRGAWLDTSYFSDISGRAVSLFDNPNILGMYLVLVLPFTLYALVKAQKGRAKLLGAIAVACVLLCILLTWSRAAWISAIICVILFFLLISRRTLRYLFLLCGVIPFVPFFLPDSVTKRFMSIGDMADSSTMYRFYTWKGTVRAIMDNFIGGVGYGPTAFQEIYPQYAYAGIEAAEHSHNLYLQIVFGTGVFGLVAFALVIFLFLQMNLEYVNAFSEHSTQMVVVACIGAVISLLVFGMFDYVWYNYRVFFLFWVVIALACACVRIGKDDRRRHGYNSDMDLM